MAVVTKNNSTPCRKRCKLNNHVIDDMMLQLIFWGQAKVFVSKVLAQREDVRQEMKQTSKTHQNVHYNHLTLKNTKLNTPAEVLEC